MAQHFAPASRKVHSKSQENNLTKSNRRTLANEPLPIVFTQMLSSIVFKPPFRLPHLLSKRARLVARVNASHFTRLRHVEWIEVGEKID